MIPTFLMILSWIMFILVTLWFFVSDRGERLKGWVTVSYFLSVAYLITYYLY